MLPQPKLRAGRYQRFDSNFDVAGFVIGLCNGEKQQFRIPELIASISRCFNFVPEDMKVAMLGQMCSQPDIFKCERVSEMCICPTAKPGTAAYKKQTRLC